MLRARWVMPMCRNAEVISRQSSPRLLDEDRAQLQVARTAATELVVERALPVDRPRTRPWRRTSATLSAISVRVTTPQRRPAERTGGCPRGASAPTPGPRGCTRGTGSRPTPTSCTRGRWAARSGRRRPRWPGRGGGSRWPAGARAGAPRPSPHPPPAGGWVSCAAPRPTGSRRPRPGGHRGRSCVVAIESTTSRLAWSATSPKIVCLRLRCGVGPTVMKNCEPLVPGPALAMASR